MLKRVWFFAFALLLTAPGIARADQAQVFLGAAAFTGVHKDAVSTLKNLYVVALPSYALRVRHKQYEVLVEDVPPIGPIRQKGVLYGHGLKVGYGDATFTYWSRDGRFAFGIGDSLYVRENDYGNRSYDGVRSAGMRYELLGAMPLSRGQRLVARLAFSPAMHQRFMEWMTRGPRFYDFGKASLVDGSLQFEQQRGGGHEWVWGLRYLNYAGGNFPPYWDHAQERSGIVTAFGAWGFSLGH